MLSCLTAVSHHCYIAYVFSLLIYYEVVTKNQTSILHFVAQVGRLEAYTACGSVFQTAVLLLWGLARSSTTLPPVIVKMILQKQHQVMLHQQKRSYLLLRKPRRLHQVPNLDVLIRFCRSYCDVYMIVWLFLAFCVALFCLCQCLLF